MRAVLLTILNIQLRHWLVLLLGCAALKRFGFADEIVTYLQAADLDYVGYVLGAWLSLRAIYTRLRAKARFKAALDAEPGTSAEAVSRIVQQQGVIATLKSA